MFAVPYDPASQISPHSLFGPVSVLLDPSPAIKVKEQREGPVSPVLLEGCSLSMVLDFLAKRRGQSFVIQERKG